MDYYTTTINVETNFTPSYIYLTQTWGEECRSVSPSFPLAQTAVRPSRQRAASVHSAKECWLRVQLRVFAAFRTFQLQGDSPSISHEGAAQTHREGFR